MKRVVIIIFFLISPLWAQMRPDTKYKKIDTLHYEIIFPESMEEKINSIGQKLDKSYDYTSQSLGVKKDYKISVILNNKNVISNAFVTLGPSYSMFYTLPPQVDIDRFFFDDWIKLLAVHEMRHVAQIQKLNYGFNRALYFMFGDLGLAVGMELSAPGWFFEGDAVYMETALTDFGRGRLPSFSLLTRSIILSSETPNYSQIYLGSDVNVYPDIYEFGYLMSAWLRQQYGNDVYDKILKFSSTWDMLSGPYAFQLGVFFITGNSLYENYRGLMSFLSLRWRKNLENIFLTDFDTIKTKKKSYYTEYTRPQTILDNGSIFVYKKGKFHRGSIVQISPKGKEKVILFTGNLTGSICVNENTIMWSEQQPDIRWDEGISVVKWYDLKTKTIHKYKTNGRIFAPSVSYDDRFIAAMQVDQNGDSWLVIFDKTLTEDALIEKIKAPPDTLWQTPRFGANSEKIALIESTAEGKSIITYDLIKKKFVKNLQSLKHQLSDPFIYKKYILFHSDIKGIDNIFAVNIDNGEIKQITSVTLGAFYPFVSSSDDYIYFSNFSRMGHDIARMKYQPEKWTTVNKNDLETAKLFPNTDPSKDELAGSIFQDTSDSQYKISNYSSFMNFLNFHSRYIYPDGFLNNINAVLISGNKLQTHFIALYYTYRTNENSHNVGSEWTFRGWYPIITLGGNYGNRNYSDIYLNKFSWTEKNAYADFIIPFYISRGAITQNISLKTHAETSSISDFKSYNRPYLINTTNFNGDVSFAYNLLMAGNPRLFDNPYFNFGFSVFYTPELVYANKSSSGWDEEMYITVPGLLNNNRIVLTGIAAQHVFRSYLFASDINSSTHRGDFINLFNDQYTFTSDYILPLIYPDLNIFHVLYMRQISLTLFFEHIWFRQTINSKTFTNKNYFGTELLFNFNIFEIKSDIKCGIRLVYDLENNNITYRPVLNLLATSIF
ncbi:MAG: hypothetical protein OEV78_10325 [Spirochaetia bacterium]|nr:hypothetical protein [Spirochaetia bacterium]